jgi:hypothetical protein
MVIDDHQPFELSDVNAQLNRFVLRQLVGVRFAEINKFLHSFYNADEAHDFPSRTLEALNNLADIRAVMFGSQEVLGDPGKTADEGDMAALHENIQVLTAFAHKEMTVIITNHLNGQSQSLIRNYLKDGTVS